MEPVCPCALQVCVGMEVEVEVWELECLICERMGGQREACVTALNQCTEELERQDQPA